MRIRALIESRGSIESVASDLGVTEIALRISSDELSPYPTFDVLQGIVRVYAVDPCWLLTGEYDPQAHRNLLSTEDDAAGADLLRRLLRGM